MNFVVYKVWWSLLAVVVVAGCGGGSDEPRIAQVEVTNHGKSTIGFNLAINSRIFFTGEDQILDHVQAEARAIPTTDFPKVLWTFMAANRANSNPYTVEAWGHTPLLLLNSIGYGFCDDVAAAYRSLAVRGGYDARVWNLGGHVVPEVLSGTKWTMFDPDLGTYYLTPALLVAGVEELTTHPEWITQPILEGGNPDAHSAYLAEIYASEQDNHIEPWLHYQPPLPVFDHPFVLPAGASLTFPVFARDPLLSYDGHPIPRSPALMRVVLRAGWTGDLPMPFIVRDVRGNGEMIIGGQTMMIGSDLARSLLDDRSLMPTLVTRIVASTSPIEVDFMVNPVRFALDDLRQVEIISTRADDLSIVTR